MSLGILGILNVATQVFTLFGAFDKAAAVTAKVVAGAPTAQKEPVSAGGQSSWTLVWSRLLTIGGLAGPVWYGVQAVLGDVQGAAADGVFSAPEVIAIGAGFLMAVLRYKTTRPVAS